MTPEFPFSAVVGQEDLKLALLLAALDPSIGGVLLRGERGTAKSTAARALAALLPADDEGRGAPFVELPLGATEDRVVGSIDLESALREGRPRLRPGLLSRADGGVLYVDEVNLLPDHLVDLLLDAAASGRVIVERDGVSAVGAARFALIGSMNPEEGELRPQFLDRFGLSVDVRTPVDQAMRVATVQARLAFEGNPEEFVASHATAETSVRERLVAARTRLPHITPSAAVLGQISALCAQLHLDGLRGDIVLAKAARALAAWDAAAEVTAEHIQRVAPFALGHRRRRKPRAPEAPSIPPPPPPSPDRTAAANAVVPPNVAAPEQVRPVSLAVTPDPSASSGRRTAGEGAPAGVVRSVPLQQAGTLAPAPTLVAAAVRGARIGDDRLQLRTEDLRQHERRGRQSARVLFLVDASGSMAAQRRIAFAKGVVLGLLDSSYQRRDEVGVVVASGDNATLRLPFTRRIEEAETILRDVPTGGRTPLAHALELAVQLCESEPRPWVVLLTDGRANVAVHGGDAWGEALAAAASLARAAAGTVVVDCEPGPVRLGRARELAATLGAEIVALEDIDEERLTVRLRGRLSGQ